MGFSTPFTGYEQNFSNANERLSMLTVFSKVIVIFAIVAVGFFCKRKGILTDAVEGPLVDLLLLVTCPLMVLSSLASRTLEPGTLPKTLMVLGISMGYFIIAMAVSFGLKGLLKNTPKEDLGVMMAIMTSLNSGFMGFPVTKAIFGDDMFFLIVIQNISLNIYFYSMAIIQINYGHEESSNLKSALKSAINPNIIAAFVGLIILFTQIKLPEPALEFTKMLGDVTTPLSMIIVGMRLAKSNIMSIIKNRDLVLTSCISMFLMPCLVFLLVNWLPVPNDVKMIAVWASCFPCAVVVVTLAAKYKRNATLAAEGMALTTSMSLVLLPIAATILSSIYGA